MLNSSLIILGKLISAFSKQLNFGNGSTWPGHIALTGSKNFIKDILRNSHTKVILIAGTNGKTTTAKLIRTMLEKSGKKVIQNESGANLLNGIASALLLQSNFYGKLEKDFAIFEVDENTLPLLLKEVSPDFIILLNLFRDQLDRYGEVNTIAEKWQRALQNLDKKSTLILNADDPSIAYLGQNGKVNVRYFSFKEESKSLKKHTDEKLAVDSIHCPRCGEKLHYTSVTFSHLGNWKCFACRLEKPTPDINTYTFYPLPGIYNRYNTHAAVLTVRQLGIKEHDIAKALHDFTPAFGRQEELLMQGKRIRIFLSKNPTSFNQSYETIRSLGAKTILFILNDRIPDGRDISWIWDTELARLQDFRKIFIAGDRVYDMALRVKYELQGQNQQKDFETFENLQKAIDEAVNYVPENETLFILPTYSAMLEVRKVLTGKKIS